VKRFYFNTGRVGDAWFRVSFTLNLHELRLLLAIPNLVQGQSIQLKDNLWFHVSASDSGVGHAFATPDMESVTRATKLLVEAVRSYNFRILLLYGMSERDLMRVLALPSAERATYRDVTDRIYSQIVVNYGSGKSRDTQVLEKIYEEYDDPQIQPHRRPV